VGSVGVRGINCSDRRRPIGIGNRKSTLGNSAIRKHPTLAGQWVGLRHGNWEKQEFRAFIPLSQILWSDPAENQKVETAKYRPNRYDQSPRRDMGIGDMEIALIFLPISPIFPPPIFLPPRVHHCTSRLNISPGSHSTITSNGRQQISQSVVKRWLLTLVSMLSSKLCPQKGH